MARKKTDPAAAGTPAPVEAAPKPARKKKADPAPPAPVEAAAPPAERRRPTREQIAERARAHWRDGSADSVANWLRAEQELDQELNRRD